MDVNSQLHTQTALFLWLKLLVLAYRKMGESQSFTGWCGEEKNLCLYQRSNPSSPAVPHSL